eukprot:scaffold1220_cov259-Pinguiococcus_pyrenoidosus.AAC.61
MPRRCRQKVVTALATSLTSSSALPSTSSCSRKPAKRSSRAPSLKPVQCRSRSSASKNLHQALQACLASPSCTPVRRAQKSCDNLLGRKRPPTHHGRTQCPKQLRKPAWQFLRHRALVSWRDAADSFVLV